MTVKMFYYTRAKLLDVATKNNIMTGKLSTDKLQEKLIKLGLLGRIPDPIPGTFIAKVLGITDTPSLDGLKGCDLSPLKFVKGVKSNSMGFNDL